MRHVMTPSGFVRCPSCFVTSAVTREMGTRQLPPTWMGLDPDSVIQAFGATTPVGASIAQVLSGAQLRVHAYGMPGERRHAYMGALAYGFIRQGRGVQVCDTGDLAVRHFNADDKTWTTIVKQYEPTILQLGREVETKLGLFYFRALLERSLAHHLPLVLVTDASLDIMNGRYQELRPLIESVGFDRVNLWLQEDHAGL